MGEIKSVKVDNWGVFFLQKLQNFFNKTDYCDLTLQFNDNSQLKVHRLVLSACTDYFNILEIQSDVVDNTLLMPKDFQADVVVPIVNFMYTGTLEFEYNMYDKLFRTAREMNMTVLVKLLEAHRKSTPPTRPIVLNKSLAQSRPAPVSRTIQSVPVPQSSFPQRVNNVTERTYASNKKLVGRPLKQHQQAPPPPPTPQKNVKYISNFGKNRTFKESVPETIAIVSNYRQTDIARKSGPSRFDPAEEEVLPDSFDTFNTISYESTPLMKAEEKDDDYGEYEGEYSASSSTFEQLRKGYTNPNKRPAPKMVTAPPAKKFNLQDVKEYTEAARLRKQLEVEEDDENAFDYDADTHFDDEDEASTTAKSARSSQNSSIKEKSFDSSLITAKDDQIIVKDNSGSVHHARIISEVLKKYPHLVKNNKNIKLKILQKNNSSPTSVTVQEQKPAVEIIKQEKVSPIRYPIKTEKEQMKLSGPSQPVKTIAPVATPPTGPKKIDSKTMHALIAKGAENMTGPWLCLRCGVGKRPISIPSYKSFRRHLIQVHKEKIDPRICEHCGWKATKKNDLVEHYLNKHNIKIKIETAAKNQPSTSKNGCESQQKGEIQHCIYCNKTFSKEILLYSHMKSMHKEKALEDGVLDFSDEEQDFDDSDKYVPNAPNAGSQNEKIKILSNISLPPKGIPFVIDSTTAQTISQLSKTSGQSAEHLVKLEPSSEAEALSNVASGIATSLGLIDNTVVMDETHYHQSTTEILTEQYEHDESTLQNVIEQGTSEGDIITKLVTTDGQELSQFQKDEIISQIHRQASLTSENVVMVLNQESFEGNEILTTNNQNIVVVYSQTENDDGTTTLTTVTSKTSETMEWQENVAEPQEEKRNEKTIKQKSGPNQKVGQKSETEKKNEEEKLKLISALEGDWSEDEDEEPIAPIQKPEATKKPVAKKDESENLDLIKKSLQETTELNSPVKERTPEEIMSELLGVDKMDEVTETSKGENESTKPTVEPTSTDKESDAKELTNILGEWSSESFEGIKHDESEEVEVSIEDTSTTTNGADDSNSKIKDDEEQEVTEVAEIVDIEDENSSTKPTSNTSNSSTTPVEPKEDIKTLINDWDDDDTDM